MHFVSAKTNEGVSEAFNQMGYLAVSNERKKLKEKHLLNVELTEDIFNSNGES